MGLAAFGASIANEGFNYAQGFLTDMAPLFGLMAGIAAAGLLVGIFARFVGR